MEIKHDQEIQQIEQTTPTIIEKVGALEIKDEGTAKVANDLVVGIKKMLKSLDDKRKFFVKPLNDHVKSINNEFKLLTNPLEDALKLAMGKLSGYMKDLRKKQEEEAKQTTELESELLDEDVKAKVSTQVTSSMGKTFLRKTWTFEVENFSKVPDEYKLINEKAIRALITGNTKTVKGESVCDVNIPGVKIYQQERLGTRG